MSRDIIDIRYTNVTPDYAEVEVVRETTDPDERAAGQRRIALENFEVPVRAAENRVEVMVDGEWREARRKTIPNARDWTEAMENAERGDKDGRESA